MDRRIVSEQTKTVDLGSLPFEYEVSNGRHFFNVYLSDIKPAINDQQIIPAICPGYRSVTNFAAWVNKDVGYRLAKGNCFVTFVNNDYSNATSFKQAMNGVPFTYVTNQQSKEYTVLETCGQVDLGSLTWQRSQRPSGNYYFWAALPKQKYDYRGTSGYLTIYDCIFPRSTAIYDFTADKTINWVNFNNYNQVGIRYDEYTTSASFKQAMQGVILTYELANPKPYAIKNVITI